MYLSSGVVVDSSAWIAFFRKATEAWSVVDGLLESGEALLLAPVRLEIIAGARRQDREMLRLCFAGLRFASLEDDDWIRAGYLAEALRDQGKPIGSLDLLIAAACLRLDCPIYSLDRDFEPLYQSHGLRRFAG